MILDAKQTAVIAFLNVYRFPMATFRVCGSTGMSFDMALDTLHYLESMGLVERVPFRDGFKWQIKKVKK